jgi:uncharacterized membrane protein YhiD involved in acid resistance
MDNLRRHRWLPGVLIALCLVTASFAKSEEAGPNDQSTLAVSEQTVPSLLKELTAASVRLPVAAGLGAVLALRHRRRGTPPRQPAVVQTQIVLAIVGAAIMLVIGASLARAFGIVGVAGLIRYRSKIDDPKDAVVMLCALAVGLASGAGLLALAGFATLFLTIVLFVLEGLENPLKQFEVTVKLGKDTSKLRPRIEEIFRRSKARYEMRGYSEEEVAYLVTAPLTLQTDKVSSALSALAPDGKGGVEWKQSGKSKPA